MSDEVPIRHTRAVVSPTPAAKLMVLLGVLLVLCAVYLAFSPIERNARDGRPVSCGTAFKTPGALVRITCGQSNAQRQWQAGTVLAAGLLAGFGGMWVYGGSRRIEVERLSRPLNADTSIAPPPPPQVPPARPAPPAPPTAVAQPTPQPATPPREPGTL